MTVPARAARARTARIAGYVMMACGGGVAFAIPAGSIQASAGALVYLWATFLLLGGVMCAAGALTDRWLGELVGLPLISSAFGVYCVVLGLRGGANGTAAALAFGAIALILMARHQDITVVRREAARAATLNPRGGP